MSDIITKPWKDYALLDFGEGTKVERFGDYITLRPEVNAEGNLTKPIAQWRKEAAFEFLDKGNQRGVWKKLINEAPDEWILHWEDLKFDLHLTKFKHLGVFPEQAANWKLIQDKLCGTKGGKMLNLFAYTGAASMVGKKCGADVWHVDSMKSAIDWANKNMERNGLDGVRWVKDDAMKVLNRLYKREALFDVVVMDPPAFGRAGKRIWKIEDKLDELVRKGLSVTSDGGLFILNTYTPKVDKDYLTDLIYELTGAGASIKCGSLKLSTQDQRTMNTGLVVQVVK